MTLYMENTKEYTLLESINNLARYKINIQKLILLLYISNEQPQRQIKKKKSHLQCHKKKYLGKNLTKKI